MGASCGGCKSSNQIAPEGISRPRNLAAVVPAPDAASSTQPVPHPTQNLPLAPAPVPAPEPEPAPTPAPAPAPVVVPQSVQQPVPKSVPQLIQVQQTNQNQNLLLAPEPAPLAVPVRAPVPVPVSAPDSNPLCFSLIFREGVPEVERRNEGTIKISKYFHDAIATTVMAQLERHRNDLYVACVKYKEEDGGDTQIFYTGTTKKSESFLQCFVRETKEETGFSLRENVEPYRFRYTIKRGNAECFMVGMEDIEYVGIEPTKKDNNDDKQRRVSAVIYGSRRDVQTLLDSIVLKQMRYNPNDYETAGIDFIHISVVDRALQEMKNHSSAWDLRLEPISVPVLSG